MEQIKNHVQHEFEPVYDEYSQILILGTLPSVKSRENHFYYGHPQNRFWKLLAYLTQAQIPETIEQKKSFLLEHHIAVWDVIAECDIIGSSDSSISNVTPTDLSRDIITLPSTSPANAAFSMERLAENWNCIFVHLTQTS